MGESQVGEIVTEKRYVDLSVTDGKPILHVRGVDKLPVGALIGLHRTHALIYSTP